MILKHVTHSLPVKIEYFYDGLTVVKDGIVEVDADDEAHARVLWLRGYRMTKDGKQLYDWQDVVNYSEGKKSKKPTTA